MVTATTAVPVPSLAGKYLTFVFDEACHTAVFRVREVFRIRKIYAVSA